jgi:hypothetical protein
MGLTSNVNNSRSVAYTIQSSDKGPFDNCFEKFFFFFNYYFEKVF